jgi:hypothetical protein
MRCTVRRERSEMNEPRKLTKSEERELLKLYPMKRMGMDDMVARSLSALIRAAMTERSRRALMQHADVFEVLDHPEFIV